MQYTSQGFQQPQVSLLSAPPAAVCVLSTSATLSKRSYYTVINKASPFLVNCQQNVVATGSGAPKWDPCTCHTTYAPHSQTCLLVLLLAMFLLRCVNERKRGFVKPLLCRSAVSLLRVLGRQGTAHASACALPRPGHPCALPLLHDPTHTLVNQCLMKTWRGP